jgi:glycosyltransferase involved in cell wall biosynthesis
MGYQSHLISARSKNKLESNQPNEHITLIPLKRLPFVLPLIFGTIMSFLLPIYIMTKKPQYVIMEPNVHVILSLPSVIVARLKKVKMILDIRSVPVETFGFRGFMERLWFFVSVQTGKKFFDGMTIITPLMKKEICGNFGINSRKVGVWTSGVSLAVFNPNGSPQKSAHLRENLKLDDKFVVFYHGVFTASRGLDETLQAMKLIKPKYPNVVFFLLGDGPTANLMRNYVENEGLQENVVIHGKVEQSYVPDFIGVCDVGIVPLPYNIFWRFQSPLKLLEYLSMKKVVILSDIPAHRAVVENETCAIYLNAVKPADIAESIIYCYENKAKLSSWGNIGRAIIEEEFTWERVAENLEDYLLSIDQMNFHQFFNRLKD